MKKAEYGAVMKDPKKPMSKKPMAPTPKKKTYPILSDDGENYNGPKAGPREKTPGGGFSRNGSMMKKAKDGSSLGMKSVKAGYDDNAGVTRADFVSIGKGEAKNGTKMKMGGAMAKQAAVAIAMKKAGKTPKKKMQYGGEAASMAPMKKGGMMKKAMMGSSMMADPMMKKGGMMKKCKYGCK